MDFLAEPADGPRPPPRLTTFLRAFSRGPIDLRSERAQRARHSGTGGGASGPATQLTEALGASRPGNELLRAAERLLAAVRNAIGLDSSGEELAEASLAALSTLNGVRDPRDEAPADAYSERTRREHALHAEHRSRRKHALESALGSVSISAVDDVASAADKLMRLVSVNDASCHRDKNGDAAYASDEEPDFGIDLGDVFASLPSSSTAEESNDATQLHTGDVSSSNNVVHSGPGAVSWMTERCREIGARTGQASDELASAITQAIMSSEKTDEAIGADLFGLLGESGISFIEGLVARRSAISSEISRRIDTLKEKMGEGSYRKTNAPALSSQVSVKSQREIDQEKARRKGERKAKRNAAQGANEQLEWLSNSGVSFAAVLEYVEDEKDTSVVGSNVGAGSNDPTALALPSGASRFSYQSYEEVEVPATSSEPPDVKFISINELDEWMQPAFNGMKRLNQIQSQIFSVAFRTNENMLVCAPTGAGKTNIAMLAILHELSSHMRGETLLRDQFKIVYVAPMKALAAEQAENFSKRLKPLGVNVREFTGDMQLTKMELENTQMLITTPEKWDVVTRKSGEMNISSIVKLLIVDEVHLLNDERGPVIETIVSRTQRQVETSQSMIRIVGLSATLPNPKDVGKFLGVSESTGLFHFDNRYRPVPLHQSFLGVKDRNAFERQKRLNELAYKKAIQAIKGGKQAMIFVHSRKETARTARSLREHSTYNDEAMLFDCSDAEGISEMNKEIKRSRNKEIQEFFPHGLGVHHAGMLRSDRSLMERAFRCGALKVLVCTATLAWGVNLPAHMVVIKGTNIYDGQKGGFKDLGVLDVQQIFGRAGRPQFDTSGHGVIITEHSKLNKYLSMLTRTVPIESQFTKDLPDHLNAEIVLGNVTNVREGAQWLRYSYFARRMRQNPLAYGLKWEDLRTDPLLSSHCRNLISEAADSLDKSKMIRYDKKGGHLYVTEGGRIASHFYIKQKSMEEYNDNMKTHMTMKDVLHMVSLSSEFENIVPRDDEMPELESLCRSSSIPYEPKEGLASRPGKTNVLIQAYISRYSLDAFSLVADTNYISQNIGRICRALFELCLRRGWPSLSDTLLTLAKACERRVWPFQHCLRQFDSILSAELLHKLENRRATFERLYDMRAEEIGSLLKLNTPIGKKVRNCIDSFPNLDVSAILQPITRTVVRVQVTIEAAFKWKDSIHGASQRWLLWVEDQHNEYIYHSDTVIFTKKQAHESPLHIAFSIPLSEPLPPEYYLRLVSQDWLGAENWYTLDFRNLILPNQHKTYTELLDLTPLPLSALNEPKYEELYTQKLTHFNPIQTQAFHTLYHTDKNVLLGAPTGSGKTKISELSLLRVFHAHPDRKVVYIAPLKALVRERVEDWRNGICKKLGKNLVELTGDHTPDMRALLSADVIVSTPEKWDGISRHWQTRAYVRKVALVIIDEIHLLGAGRGPILEVIVSRMRYIASKIDRKIRIIGLSTALANAQDVGDWLGILNEGMFNFRPSVRPVPLEVHIQGFPGKHYCPRMLSMNKPTYAAIRTHSPDKPVLVFVSSRRQTRLTALDIIAYAAADQIPDAFLHCDSNEVSEYIGRVTDDNLKHALQFGVGIHHAGLAEEDRIVVEEMFLSGKIQVLVCTSTLAWGVNFPAHLVVVKGTEYYDGQQQKYVDFPITDILQMMGRAGRPQYDATGTCCIMVHEPKKSFYKKFLYEPFPVESSLLDALPDHLNAEIVAGSLKTKQDVVDYITWTYFFRRLLQNPSYYGLDDTSDDALNKFLATIVNNVLFKLEQASCVKVDDEDQNTLRPLLLGTIASYYYLKHETASIFVSKLRQDATIATLLQVLSSVAEFDELPVRHNEDRINAELADKIVESGGWKVDTRTAEDPHTKANLLFQAHFLRLELPLSDYITDTKNVLDQSIRIMQAMVDVMADQGWLESTLRCMNLTQMLVQGRLITDSSLMTLPHIDKQEAIALERSGYSCLPVLADAIQQDDHGAHRCLKQLIGSESKAKQAIDACRRIPLVQPTCHLNDKKSDSNEAQVNVRITNAGAAKRPQRLTQAYCPRFPKAKEDAWWLVIGDTTNGEVLALKRMAFTRSANARLTVPRESLWNECKLFLMSDTYMGIDQEVTLLQPQKSCGGSSDGEGPKAEAI